MEGFKCREPLGEEGFRLVGAAMELYNEKGPGLTEAIYQERMEIELELRGLPFNAMRELRKRYLSDLVVFARMIAELKALKSIEPEHESPLLNYMHLTRSPVGYLLNFSSKSGLPWK